VRRALAALLTALLCGALIRPAGADGRFDKEMAAREIGLALAFMAPRILDPEPVWQLALWGLRALTTLDPRLRPSLGPTALTLAIDTADGGRLLADLPAPRPDDAAAWGAAVAVLLGDGWNASAPMRKAGGGALVQTFFDEVFNHLDPYSRYVGPDAAIAEAESEPTPVSGRLLEGMLVLRIPAFTEDTAAELARAIAGGVAQRGRRHPHGLVLDLRGNRGGVLDQAAEAAGTLLDSGPVASTRGRDPAADHDFQASGPDLAPGLPVVVVVDGRSASAAEILAAALADRRRAVVVGSETLGKGLVQTILPLPDGGALYVSWSRVLAPLGWPLQGLGVMPQLCTSLGAEATYRQLALLAGGTQAMSRALARNRDARAPLPAAEALEIRAACPAAEGSPLDLVAARTLIEHRAAYQAALIGPP
jgi:hypothetical protein